MRCRVQFCCHIRQIFAYVTFGKRRTGSPAEPRSKEPNSVLDDNTSHARPHPSPFPPPIDPLCWPQRLLFCVGIVLWLTVIQATRHWVPSLGFWGASAGAAAVLVSQPSNLYRPATYFCSFSQSPLLSSVRCWSRSPPYAAFLVVSLTCSYFFSWAPTSKTRHLLPTSLSRTIFYTDGPRIEQLHKASRFYLYLELGLSRKIYTQPPLQLFHSFLRLPDGHICRPSEFGRTDKVKDFLRIVSIPNSLAALRFLDARPSAKLSAVRQGSTHSPMSSRNIASEGWMPFLSHAAR